MKYLYVIKKITRLIVPVMLLSALLFSTARASAEFYEKEELPGNSGVQQGIVITGRVTSGIDNTVLPGVSIVVRGTQKGTVANSSGEYSIEGHQLPRR